MLAALSEVFDLANAAARVVQSAGLGASARRCNSPERYSWSDIPEPAARAASTSLVPSGTLRMVIDTDMHAF